MVIKYLCFHRSKKPSSSSKRPYPTLIAELCHPFSLADLRKATNNFSENQVIGEGSFGRVYKGCLQLDHDHVATTSVAVKVRSKFSMQGSKEFKNEIELLCQLRHPNLISLIGFCIDNDEQIIVYKHMSNGSLADRILNTNDVREPLSWKKRLEICIGAARAVHYLHTGLKRIVIHRGIKPSNILLDENLVPKISGFKLSLQGPLFTAEPKPIEGKPIVGTTSYLAPEYVISGTLTDKSDVYLFGMVLIHVVCAKQVNTIYNEMIDEYYEERNGLVSYIMRRLRVKDIDPVLRGNIAAECYAVYIDIIDKCLKHEWNERPTMGEVEMELERALTLQQEADNASITQPQQQESA